MLDSIFGDLLQYCTYGQDILGDRIIFDFQNGWSASLVKGLFTYGMTELAVFYKGQLHYDNEVASGDVVRYDQGQDEILRLISDLRKIQSW